LPCTQTSGYSTNKLKSTMAIGIAIIGSGIFVKEEHLPAVQAVPELVSVKAIYSRSLKSAKAVSEKLSAVELYSDDSEGKTFDDLLKRDDIKAVIIAYVHVIHSLSSAHSNKHLVSLSPISQNTSRKPSQPGNTFWPKSPSPKTSPLRKTFSHGPRTPPTPTQSTALLRTSASSIPSYMLQTPSPP